MNKILNYFAIFISFVFVNQAKGQELNANVSVNIGTVGIISDPSMFKSLELDLKTFFNRTKWTNDEFKEHEKIKCDITINIESENPSNVFRAQIIVKSSRPVYNSTYETSVLNFVDPNTTFSYNIGQVIQRSDNIFNDNLSSTMTFLAYIILGYDYDTFSLNGGDAFFQLATEVRNALPNSLKNSPEWEDAINNGRNKFFLVNDMIDPRMKPYRNFVYKYHRQMLDEMHVDPDKQRAIMTNEISDLQSIIQSYPNSMALQIFTDTKRSEIIEIFKVADSNQKSRIYETMLRINPSLSQVFEPLTK